MKKNPPLFCGHIYDEKFENEESSSGPIKLRQEILRAGSGSIAADLGKEIVDVFFATAHYKGIKVPSNAIFKAGRHSAYDRVGCILDQVIT